MNAVGSVVVAVAAVEAAQKRKGDEQKKPRLMLLNYSGREFCCLDL